jgi:hypothetical protein
MKLVMALLLSSYSLFFSPLLTAKTSTADEVPLKQWRFTVYLDDKKIGFHNFTLSQKNDEQYVYSTARFDVKFLFFTAYSYEHDNVEQWKGQCLTKITALTNDNGEQYSVDGQLVDNGFNVATGEINTVHPPCIKTFAYWDPSFLETSRLLNSQTGKLETVASEYIGEQTLEVNGEPVPAHRYRLVGDKLQIDLWYSEQNQWLALESLTEDGYSVRYQLQ